MPAPRQPREPDARTPRAGAGGYKGDGAGDVVWAAGAVRGEGGHCGDVRENGAASSQKAAKGIVGKRLTGQAVNRLPQKPY